MEREDRLFTLYPYFDAVIESGSGSTLRDKEGKEYLDLASGQLSVLLGHSHPAVVEAATKQAARLVHLGNRFFGAAVLEACEELGSITPEGMDKVILCSTGSEANEMAVRIARAATGHHELVGVSKGYYGCTHEMLSLSDYVGFIKGLGTRAAGLHRFPAPDCLHCPLGLTHPDCGLRCVSMGEDTLEKESTGAIAAILVEPVMGSGGIVVPPDEFFTRIRALADKYGALLIADEAQTGLGRTGKWWGMEHSGVVPDIIVASKGLGNGFPVAAVITTAKIEQKCLQAPLANMSSHSFDPFGAAVAGAVIRTIREEGLLAVAEETGAYLLDSLRQLAERRSILERARGRGMMVGVDVVSRDGSGLPDPMLSLALEAECLRRGAVLGYSALSGVMRLLPPLVMTHDEIDRALQILDEGAAYIEENGVDISRYMPSQNSSAMLAISFLRKLQ